MSNKDNQTNTQSSQSAESSTQLVGKSLASATTRGQPEIADGTESKSILIHPEHSKALHEISFATEIHEYIREQIQFADQKAAFIFVAAAATLGYLNDKGVTKLWKTDPRGWNLTNVFSFCAVILLVIGSSAALFVILPRLKGASRGIVFWKSICLFQHSREYADEIMSTPKEKLLQEKLGHVYELAKVCSRKYTMLNLAVWTGGIGLFVTVLYFALS